MSIAIRLAIAVALILLLVQAVDIRSALLLLGDAQPSWLALAGALLSGQIALSAWRWSMTAHALGHALPFRLAWREYYLGMLLNLSLPGGVLGDAGRVVRARGTQGLAGAATAVFIERASGQTALVLTLATGLLFWPPVTAWGPALVGTSAVMMSAVAVLLWLAAPPFRRLALAFRQCWAPWPRAVLQGSVNAATVACTIGAMAACSAAVGAPLGAAALVVVPMALLTMVLPFSIGGWGVREGAAVLLWPLAGQSAEAAIAASIAFGTLGTVTALPGLAVIFGRRRTITEC